MDQKRACEMGHFRFGVISPLLSQDDPRRLKERIEEQAEKIWTLADGRLRQYAPATIEDWYYDYRKDGFEALINPPRRDKGAHRVIGEDICQFIDQLLEDYPTLKSTNVIRQLDKQNVRVDGSPVMPHCFAICVKFGLNTLEPVKNDWHSRLHTPLFFIYLSSCSSYTS